MKDEELREKIVDIISEWYGKCITNNDIASLIIAHIEEAGYVRLADDQSLPVNGDMACLPSPAYDRAQRDMQKAGWRKVEL